MKRKISSKRILECYDIVGENLTVISYNRISMKMVKIARHLNIFQAFREISLRNTRDTYSVITYNLPKDIYKYKDVKDYILKIDDITFGERMPPKKSS